MCHRPYLPPPRYSRAFHIRTGSAQLDAEAEKEAEPILEQAVPAPAPAMAAAAPHHSVLGHMVGEQGMASSAAVRASLASVLRPQQLAQVPEEVISVAYKAALAAAAQSKQVAGGATPSLAMASAAASGAATPRATLTPRQR